MLKLNKRQIDVVIKALEKCEISKVNEKWGLYAQNEIYLMGVCDALSIFIEQDPNYPKHYDVFPSETHVVYDNGKGRIAILTVDIFTKKIFYDITNHLGNPTISRNYNRLKREIERVQKEYKGERE